MEQLLLTDVDISAWDTDHRITAAYELTFSCSEPSCPQYPGDGAEQRKIGTYTFTDAELCHKKVNETIRIQHLAADNADDSVTLQLTSDTSLSQVVFHAQSTPYAICTESYYTTNCWECTGCDDFFLNADCTGNKFERNQMEFPAEGHRMQYIDAKGPTCVDRGTVAHWQCERCKVTFSDQQGEHELTKLETDAPLVPHQYDNDGTCTVCSGKAAAGVRAGGSTAWYDTLDAALTALDADDATELVINKDCAAVTMPGKTCTVQVKEGATVDRIDIADTDGSQITVINHGTVKELYGYTGRVTLQSGSGTYGLIVNSSASGSAGSFLYRESAAKFCCYKMTNGTWLRPDEVTESSVRNAAVVYAPLASLTITGAGITGSGDAYALAARQGTPVTLTAAAVSLSGFSSENVTYRWYYEDEPATLLSEAAELVLENSKAGKRTIICTAAADGYTVSVRLTATVDGVKDPQTFTVKLSKDAVGIGEKLLPFLSVEGLRENASVTYYQMLGAAPDPTKDTVIDGDFAFTATGEYQIYAYAGETDNYAATASIPAAITVTPHANHCYCGGTFNHTHKNVEWQAWDGRSAITYTNKTAYVYLTDSVTFSSNLVVDGTTLCLCLHGKTYASNGTSKIQVKNGGRLVLCDCAGGGTIKGAAKGWGGSCFYLYQSTLDIFGGTITGGKVTGKGGGGAIALDDSKCVLNIYGGAISNNNGYFTGGAIFLNSNDKTGGTVRMYGGTISGNTAKKGGVIFSSCGGTILLAGGTISGNTATDGDGGVINMAGGTITLSGAKLTGNTSSRYGGAVYLYNGVTASMTGGEISGNQAASEGGAVHVYGTSTFNLSGGKITGNSSVDGGAIYLNREPSVLNMTDGVISGNTATGNGGGVYIFRTRSICNLSGGTIENNTAGGSGGGIYVNPKNSGQLKLSGAPTVRNNTVSGAANNVYLPTGKTLTVSGSMAKGALIGVTTQNTGYPVAFSGVYGTNYEDCFSADDAAAHVEYRDDQMLYLVSGAPMQKFTITVDVPGGHGTASASRITAVAGTQITLTATPDDGYHLKNWGSEPAVTFTGSTFDMPASNVTVSAYFEAHSFTAETAGEQYLKSAATCTESAVYYKSCTGCGLSSKDTADEDTFVYGDPEGHTWSDWASNNDGTHTRRCTVSGCTASETDNCAGTDDGDCTTAVKCGVCGYVITAAKAEHTWDGWASNDDGTHTRRCTLSGCTASETDNCAGTDDGDCTTAVTCDVCDYVITAAKAEHTWGGWVSNDDGTHTRRCTISGCTASETDNCAGTDDGDCTTAVTCDVCGYVITAAKAEHTWDGWASNNDGTHTRRCTLSGCTASETDNCAGTDDGDCTTALNCEVCGYIITAAKAEHTWDGWASNDNGTHTRRCTIPGCTASETDNCAGTDDGDCTTAVKCGVCGYVITAAKADHTWDGWASNDDGTHTRKCTLSGCTASQTDNCAGTDDGDCTTAVKCGVCGYVITAAKAEHTWGGWASNDNGTHTRGCTLSGCTASETESCAGGTADCVNKAVCTTCGGQYGEIDPAHHAAGCKPTWTTTKTEHEQKYSLCGKVTVAKAAHSFGEWRITQAPTTSQSGERARTCGICGYQETAVIPASGSGSSTSDSYYTIKATAGDNGSISPSGDVSVREGGDQTFTITPKQGYAVSDVKVDGKSIGAVKSYTFKNVSTSHTIEVTFAKAVGTPQTGDSSQMPLWLVLLSVSASGLTGTVLYSRRKRSK